MELFEIRRVNETFTCNDVVIPQGTEVEILSIPVNDRFTKSGESILVRVLDKNLQERLGREVIIICKSLLPLSDLERQTIIYKTIFRIKEQIEKIEKIEKIESQEYFENIKDNLDFLIKQVKELE